MNRVDLIESPEALRALIAECEVSGKQTLFTRGVRPVAVLVSFDEYIALRETIGIANDAELVARLNEEGERIVADFERVRIATGDYEKLSDHERELVDVELAKLDDDPIAGAPLLDPLRGLWVLRLEWLRVLYRIEAEAREIVVLAIVRAEPLR
ncbi:MAG TPA: hypothetical protein VFN10_17455 [Thermoanaerobaculia bacterium]|nr:hypothetical protein [Thermoanaerobaculia bacterium]